MIDPGSAVNLLPKRTYFKLVNVTSKLEESSIIVQGFDKHPQIPLGGINQQVRFGTEKRFILSSGGPSSIPQLITLDGRYVRMLGEVRHKFISTSESLRSGI